MRKNYIVKGVLILLAFIWLSCKEKEKAAHHDPAEIEIDRELAHLIKPSNSQVVSKLPVIRAIYGSRIFTEEVQGVVSYDSRNEQNISSRVTGRIEKLWIRYNYQPVQKGQLIMEIYSPDLVAAQQELLFIARNGHDPLMLNAARQRLLLLGMNTGGINRLLKTGQVTYRVPVYSNASGFIVEKQAARPTMAIVAPAQTGGGMDGMGGGSGAPSPAASTAESQPAAPVMLREGQYVNAGSSLFTVYNSGKLLAEFSLKPALAAVVRQGDPLVFYKTADKEESRTANIGIIQPTLKNGENFTIARVYLPGSKLQISELLTARIPVRLPASWWLPEAAVRSVGNKSLVFRKEDQVFIPIEVSTGVVLSGMVQVKTDIGDWDIAKDAAYLVDSESFIKMKTNR